MSRSPRSSRRFSFAALAAATMLVLSACGGDDGAGSGNSSGFQTLTDGKLTIATGEPAFSPWVENNKPESGEGFEAAVAYAVAEELGFEDDDVVWVRTPFDTVIAPGPKNFDVNIQQFSITPERQKAVDFSSPYYVTSQAVLTVEGTAAAGATSLADLKDVKFGVATGSNSAKIIEDQVAPKQEIGVFNSNDDAIAALTAGQIDAVVTDLPTVLYMAAAVLDKGVVVGQFDTSEGGDEYAFLLPKDSPLTAAVTGAVDTLREDGTLDELAEKWLAEGAGAPVLK
ncbi:MAG: ABC transporter substrate-binding protein [Ancrocorticia sp.]